MANKESFYRVYGENLMDGIWSTRVKQEKWVKMNMELYPKADKQVMEFIAKVIFNQGESNVGVIQGLFTQGYCYYFANMMKLAFHRGIICYVYDIGHFVWVDNGVAYDVEGVYELVESEYLIPEDKIGDFIKDFMHVPGVYCMRGENEFTKILLDAIENKEYVEIF